MHRTPKANRKIESLIAPGKASSTKHAYKISQTSLRNSYASLNVFFKWLIDAELVMRNYLADAKKNCKYLINGKIYQPPHTFDDEVWDTFIQCLTDAADENPKFEIHRFVVLSLKETD